MAVTIYNARTQEPRTNDARTPRRTPSIRERPDHRLAPRHRRIDPLAGLARPQRCACGDRRGRAVARWVGGWGPLLLDQQRPDGQWGDGVATPFWWSNMYTLLFLRDLGLEST